MLARTVDETRGASAVVARDSDPKTWRETVAPTLAIWPAQEHRFKLVEEDEIHSVETGAVPEILRDAEVVDDEVRLGTAMSIVTLVAPVRGPFWVGS